VRAILLDMIMPRMSGKEAFISLRKIDPGVKILFTSGFKQDERVAEVIRMGVNGFIQKPYVMHELSRKMKEVIDQ
jgi:two-component system, cell cycle sensor histidine kinase and response regulator CckA